LIARHHEVTKITKHIDFKIAVFVIFVSS